MSIKKIDIYTDGSYHDLDGFKDRAYGAIYIPSAYVDEWQFSTNNPIYVKSRNVGGEILAAEFAVSLIAKHYDSLAKKGEEPEIELNIYYDYEGIGKWLNGEWRAKMVLTQKYKTFVTRLLSNRKITLKLHHVRGHAGNVGNERVDKLASEAYLSERCYDAKSFVEEVLQ